MEKKYYISENNQPKGPFSAEELRDRGLRPDTRIFVKGEVRFRDASEFPELADYMSAEPAPETDSAAGTSAVDSISEKELLLGIMRHLEELQRENRELRREVDSLRSGNGGMNQSASARDAAAAAPKPKAKATPPRLPDEVAEVESQTARDTQAEWDKEWEESQPKPEKERYGNELRPVKKNSESNILGGIIILMVIIIILTLVYSAGCRRQKEDYRDSESICTAEPAAPVTEDVAAPVAEENTPVVAAEAAAPVAEPGEVAAVSSDYYDNYGDEEEITDMPLGYDDGYSYSADYGYNY